MRALRYVLLLALASSACAAIGYDFGDYEPASSGSGGAPAIAKQAPIGSDAGVGGDHDTDGDRSTAEVGSGGGAPSGGAPDRPVGPKATTFGVGGAGDPCVRAAPEAGAAGGPDGPGVCVPHDCFEQGIECGPADDGCGAPLDCGGCFWWFLECRQHVCEIK